jgi:hypothetical protein
MEYQDNMKLTNIIFFIVASPVLIVLMAYGAISDHFYFKNHKIPRYY